MPIQTILELELSGRGQGWTDLSADLGDQAIEIEYGIQGNSVADRVASAGTAKLELVNQNPAGKYSLRHENRMTGFALGIGVRIRLLSSAAQGSGAGYLINNGGGYAADITTVTVDTGTGSIYSDDIITFAGVTGTYIVESGGDPATSITFAPGLAGSVADDAAISLIGRNHTRFRGRIDGVQPIAGIYERRTVRIEAVDWMDDAARSKVSGIPVQLGQRADQIFETLIESVPFEPDSLEVDESPDTYAYALDSAQDERSTVLAELQKLALSELGLIYQKADGTVVFESRNRRAVSEGIVDTFTDAASISGFEAPVSRDDALSRVQVITHPRKVDAAATTVLFRLDNPLQVGAHTSVTILGPYRDPDQEAARVGGTDMVTPVATTDYLANSQSDGAGTDLTTFITLTVNFGGNGARVLIENNSSSAAWMTLLQLRGRGIYDYQNVVLEEEDAEAQINVGTTVTADMPYQDNAALGQEIALWLLNLYKDAEGIAESATIFVPRSDETLAERVLSREISDRIDIVEQMTGFEVEPMGGHFIQNVALTIDARDNLSITWGLAPAMRQQFWLLEVPGRSELDETTVLGFGQVVGHTDVSHSDSHDDGPHEDVAHFDAHVDTHVDSAHVDSVHTDSHSDTAHSDAAHLDDHEDVEHSDVSHRDSHSDVPYEDYHSDHPYVDLYDDTHTDHDDDAHGDEHGDHHTDAVVHGDYYNDVPHDDWHDDHDDGVHEDYHQDIPHYDYHSDVAHIDSHTDNAHLDSHNDYEHQDVVHTDEHDDRAYSDINHADLHLDAEHGDAAHGDEAHVDSHTDSDYIDNPHGDSHSDVSHGDVNVWWIFFVGAEILQLLNGVLA